MIECVLCIIRCLLSTLESLKYILSVADSVSIIPLSPYHPFWLHNTCIFVHPCWLPQVKPNDGGGETHIVLPQQSPSALLCFHKGPHKVFLRLHSRTIYIYSETQLIQVIYWCSQSGGYKNNKKIKEMSCCYGTLTTTPVRIRQQVSRYAVHRTQLHSTSPAVLCSSLSCWKTWLSYKSNLITFWIHLHICRHFQKHMRPLLHSLEELRFDPDGPRTIWTSIGALLKSTGVSGRYAYGIRTGLHSADIHQSCTYTFCIMAGCMMSAVEGFLYYCKLTMYWPTR